jgi:S-formylglutathione hydrolase
MEVLSEVKAFEGIQGVYRHRSSATQTDMTFAVYVPPQAATRKVPVVWYLSGLSCTHANVMDKGEYRRACAELGLMLVAPDTSPRGEGVADDANGAFDFGLGAGFYVDATVAPYAQHYRMWSYVADELPALVEETFPADLGRQGIMGHSMGGHGALTLGLRRPEQYASVSALAPIVAPSEVPWGQKAFQGYLGDDRAAWRRHDAVALLEDGARSGPIRVDQGEADPFLQKQLQPERLGAAAAKAGQPLSLHRRPGYDHSYLFVSTFMEQHLRWHAESLFGR